MSKKHLKLLIISPAPPPNGGISKWTSLLLPWLEENTAITFRHVDIATHWRRVDDLSLLKRSIGGPLQGLRDAIIVFWYFVVFRPQVMHLTTTGSLAVLRDLTILAMAKCFQVASVYHFHIGRLPEIIARKGREWCLIQRAAGMADKVIVLDRASEKELRPYLPLEKLSVVPNGINCGDLAPSDISSLGDGEQEEPGAQGGGRASNGNKIMLFLGWVIPTKGARELVEAWRLANLTGWELWVGGPCNPEYQKQLMPAGDESQVRFLGALTYPQANEQMRRADVFVLPTYTEGFPYVILEAMAAGKAIITTPVGAVPEMLDLASNAPCGMVVEPRDVRSLLQAIRTLAENDQLRKQLGSRALDRVKAHYDINVVFQKLANLWESVAR